MIFSFCCNPSWLGNNNSNRKVKTMKKLPVFLLATLIFSSVVYAPAARAQNTCKPNLMQNGILQKSRTSSGLLSISGSVVNRSKTCSASMVWAIFKVGRQYSKALVGNIQPGEEVHFSHLVDAGRVGVSLEKFDY